MAASTDGRRKQARELFVYGLKEKGEIADRIGISLSTLERYMRRDKGDGLDWYELRSAYMSSEESTNIRNREILNSFLSAVEKTIKEITTSKTFDTDKAAEVLPKLADSSLKISKTIVRLNPVASITEVALRILEIVSVAFKDHPDLSRAMADKLEDIQSQILAEFSSEG